MAMHKVTPFAQPLRTSDSGGAVDPRSAPAHR
jgi:hypothetical protein